MVGSSGPEGKFTIAVVHLPGVFAFEIDEVSRFAGELVALAEAPEVNIALEVVGGFEGNEGVASVSARFSGVGSEHHVGASGFVVDAIAVGVVAHEAPEIGIGKVAEGFVE